MTERRFIVDIRRHRGSSSYVIELVGRFCSSSPGAAVEWLVRPDQAHLLPPEHLIGQADAFDSSWTSRICERLVQSHTLNGSQSGAVGGPLWVLSYDNYLLTEVQKLNRNGLNVTTKHLAELHKAGFGSRQYFQPGGGLRTTWFPQATIRTSATQLANNYPATSISLPAAKELAKQILLQRGHTSPETALPQKELRAYMCILNPAAAKRYGDPESENLVKNLVDEGLQEGWLKRLRRVPNKNGTEALYVVVAATVISTPETAELANHTTASTDPNQPTTGFAAESQAANHSLPDLSPSASPNQVVAADPAEVEAPKPRKHPNRATEFEAVLSKSRIGSLPETRKLMFDAVEKLIGELNGKSILLTELFHQATQLAQEKGAETGYQNEKNWAVAERCLGRLMLWAGVLVDEDGRKVQDRIGSNASRIASLASDFRETCEAFLVEHIIAQLGGINYDDDQYYIGLTLYRRGREQAVPPEELKSKADAVLHYLELQGRIEMDDERIIRTKQPKKALAIAK